MVRVAGRVAFAAVALSILVGSADIATAQDRRQNEPGQFDFYVLALSWSPSFCEAAGERGTPPQQQCGARPYSFVVHGGVQKNFALRVAEIRATLPPGTPVEVWFQDEMRVGQKNKLTYRWARKGSRPRAIHDQRTQSTYLFGAVCPERGAGAALVLPACNTEAMQLHLDEIATKVTPGAHAVLILDQAGWHGAKDLKAPKNISLLPLPPRAPELNPQENIWQFMRANWLSNRIFKSFDEIVDHCCYAWNMLIDQPWKIMSIARRDWAVAGHSL